MRRTGRTAVNRVLLGLTGLLLVGVGGLVLVGGLDLERRWNLGLPSWWPLDGPGHVLLSEEDRTRWRDEGWWWPAVYAGLGLALLLLLWWLLAQFRGRRVGRIRVPVPGDEGAPVWLRGRALEDALEREACRLDGVDGARVTLHRGRRGPWAEVSLLLAPHATPVSVVGELYEQRLAEARESAGLPALPATARLRGDRHPAARVE